MALRAPVCWRRQEVWPTSRSYERSAIHNSALVALNLVGADVVEVAPPYDQGEITSLAAATVIFDLITLLARRRAA
jgi:arginase family enzyme